MTNYFILLDILTFIRNILAAGMSEIGAEALVYE